MIKRIKQIIATRIELLHDFRATRYHKRIRKKLKNTNPSIISSNCIGGIIYHDLGLRFNSPTINLTLPPNDFILFCENIDGFLNASLKEIQCDKCNYPVGELTYQNSTIKLFFMHYKTFDEALKKWEERKRRIDFNNIFIIWEFASEYGPDTELLDRFLNLKYKNKVLITGEKCQSNDRRVLKIKLYNEKYFSGKLLTYRTKLSKKRYLNDFDFVEFLNTGVVKKNGR